MGVDTLIDRSPGSATSFNWWNIFTSAVEVDMLPRNSQGVVTDLGANAGIPAFRWSSLVAQTFKIGPSGTHLVTIDVDASIAAGYGVKWPAALLDYEGLVKLDASGNMEFSLAATADFATASVTKAKNGTDSGYVISDSCGNYRCTSTSAEPIKNQNTALTTGYGELTVDITTHGRPVMLQVVCDYVNSVSSNFGTNLSVPLIGGITESGAIQEYEILLFRDDDQIDRMFFEHGDNTLFPVSMIEFLDPVAAGTYTYSLKMRILSSSDGLGAGFNFGKLIAWEIGA
jgi:hypothetical protein